MTLGIQLPVAYGQCITGNGGVLDLLPVFWAIQSEKILGNAPGVRSTLTFDNCGWDRSRKHHD